ncbi:MAG: rod shape-determining protein [Candidatus Izimaplasma sp.]|nr:rod shape-determining protein [Candidatus Izimaplasma bacterium]
MNVGVDLGTSNLLIYVEGRGTVFNEPSIIAIDKASRKVVSVGHEAAGLVGKVHDKVEVIKPLNGGVISDVDMIREILLFTFNKIFMSKMNHINRLLICIPSEITDTEKAAIMQLGKELGIENTYIDEEIKAAALGGNIDIYNPSGQLVVDIGGGTTDFGVLSLGEVVNSKSIKVAGDYFDKQVINHLKEKHKLEIGPQTSERIKVALASLTGDLPKDEEGNVLTYSAMGRDLVSGLPQQVTVNAKEIRKILLSCFEAIKASLISTLESTPPELAGDLVENGIQITGGGAQIKGIKKYFEDVTGVGVQISSFPMTAVINGTKKLLKIEKKHYFVEF